MRLAHLLRDGRPAAFGFIDHDLFPMRPTDPFAPLAQHPVAGQVRDKSGGARWFLWAGYCFYRFSAVERLPLDFSLDWNAGLDTGGANWFVLYRHLAPDHDQWTGRFIDTLIPRPDRAFPPRPFGRPARTCKPSRAASRAAPAMNRH